MVLQTAPTSSVNRHRADFPILRTPGLVYLDNGATTQKPRQVIEAISKFYTSQNANIHRGIYQLSQRATELYEGVREKVRKFINAGQSQEIIFTRGTTESINLVANCWGRANLKNGDEIILSTLEHHSNIVPWQMVAQETGAKIRVIRVNEAGELLLDEYRKLLNSRRRIVAITHVSNALGTINPVEEVIGLAHAAGAKVLVDGAQWVGHFPLDVQALDADFYAFSGHKMFGPTGIGILYGRRELLEAMPPYQGGGDMIASVSFEKTLYAELPNKFEAGTPNIAGVAGLGAAVDYLNSIDRTAAAAAEADLLAYATQLLWDIPGLKIIGTAAHKAGVISFVIDGLASYDIGMRLDLEGVAVRTGHHCCQPLMDRFGINSTTRASFSLYNTREDADALAAALHKIVSHRRAAPAPASARFAEAFAASPAEAAGKIADDFAIFDDWAGKYEYIIELGETLPSMPSQMKSEENRVQGCQATVHLTARERPENPGVLEFLADADANIVRGEIAILQRLFSGQKAAEVAGFDVDAFFARVGLDKNLSMTRRNGLASMVKRLRAKAADISRSNP